MFADMGHFNKKSIQVNTIPITLIKQARGNSSDDASLYADGLFRGGLPVLAPGVLRPSSVPDQAPFPAEHDILQQHPGAPVLANVRGCYPVRHCREPVSDICELLHHPPIRRSRLLPSRHHTAHLGGARRAGVLPGDQLLLDGRLHPRHRRVQGRTGDRPRIW
jgi:hypothetical protein